MLEHDRDNRADDNAGVKQDGAHGAHTAARLRENDQGKVMLESANPLALLARAYSVFRVAPDADFPKPVNIAMVQPEDRVDPRRVERTNTALCMEPCGVASSEPAVPYAWLNTVLAPESRIPFVEFQNVLANTNCHNCASWPRNRGRLLSFSEPENRTIWRSYRQTLFSSCF